MEKNLENEKVFAQLNAAIPGLDLLKEYDTATSTAEGFASVDEVIKALESLPLPLLEKLFKNNGFTYET
jgi:hypothetical protein